MSGGGVVVKLLICEARGPGFDYRFRRYDFSDLLSPASKSRSGWYMAHTKISTRTRTWSPPTWKYEFLEKFSIFWPETWNISLLIRILFIHFTILKFESILFLFWSADLLFSCDWVRCGYTLKHSLLWSCGSVLKRNVDVFAIRIH